MYYSQNDPIVGWESIGTAGHSVNQFALAEEDAWRKYTKAVNDWEDGIITREELDELEEQAKAATHQLRSHCCHSVTDTRGGQRFEGGVYWDDIEIYCVECGQTLG